MKRISAIALVLASIGLIILGCVQAPTTVTPKAGKPLVKRLPANIEGVELVGGTVRAKSGYKFVKQVNGTVTVARMAGGGGGGGLGIGGTWKCECRQTSPGGTCTTLQTGSLLFCGAGTCSQCDLTIETTGLRQAIIAY
jgi:hypothetical protein